MGNLELVGSTINGQSGISSAGLPLDWFNDSDYYEEWDVPNSSFDTSKWDTSGYGSASESATYQEFGYTSYWTGAESGTLTAKNTLPTNRKAYMVSGYEYGNVGNDNNSSVNGAFRFNGVNYVFKTGAHTRRGASTAEGSMLVVNKTTDTYDIYVSGLLVASNVVATTPAPGVAFSNSGTSDKWEIIRLYYLRYTKD